uniref:Vacuolar protein sorting-associated protein 62 n=1 Tax=Scylla olivacea TaxID=85551 RepID=A0A0P4W0D0_SCYOL
MAERFLLLVVMASVTESPFMILASTPQDPLLFEREVAAHRWSPLVWLHPSEAYFPSSVPFFLRHITPSTTKGHAEVQQGSRAPGLNLPSGRPSRNFYLLAPHNFECLDCTLPGFLHGQKPQKKYSPPVYVTIHTCPSLPASRAVRNTLNSLTNEGSKPTHMYVSAHTFGAYYTYDATNNRFIYEYEDTREGIPMSPVYPKIIQLSGGSHPILYSARGSHGLWGAEGTNQYNSLPLLQDETGKGTPWKIWKNLKLIDVQDPLSEQPHKHWWKYEGRWGNPSSKCHVLLAGLCEHVKGPTGIPRKRVNFPCQNI